MTILITYNGYALIEWGHGYKSEIDGRWIQFDTAGQWKQFIGLNPCYSGRGSLSLMTIVGSSPKIELLS